MEGMVKILTLATTQALALPFPLLLHLTFVSYCMENVEAAKCEFCKP